MVIIHEVGTMNLAYNKGGVMGLGMINNMLKLAGLTEGDRSGDKLNVNSDTPLRKEGSRTKEVH